MDHIKQIQEGHDHQWKHYYQNTNDADESSSRISDKHFEQKVQSPRHFNTALNKGQGGKEIFQIFEVRS